MQEKKIEFEKATVIVKYNRLPKKEDIEEACIRFLKKAMQERERKEK